MNNIKVTLVNPLTDKDLSLISDAARLTQVRDYSLTGQYLPKLVKKLAEMNHTSVFEYCDLTFFIQGCSRVFLAQITRHRHCSYTSSSQQYQVMDNFAYVIPEGLSTKELEQYHAQMATANQIYIDLEKSVGRDQARYVLPGAAKVDMLMHCNLRELLFNIIPLRSCRRNTIETQHIIRLMCNLLPYDLLTGPVCLTLGKCDQSPQMACDAPYQSKDELL